MLASKLDDALKVFFIQCKLYFFLKSDQPLFIKVCGVFVAMFVTKFTKNKKR